MKTSLRWWIGGLNVCFSQSTSVFWPFGQPDHTSLKCWFTFDNSIPSPARPLLVIALDVSLFLSREVHARRSTSTCSPECRNSSSTQDSLLFTTRKSPPNHSLMDVSVGSVFSQTFGPHDGADPTFRIAEPEGCINKGAKERWTRWRWSSLVFTLFLQLQAFSYWPVVVLLHPCCATLTPEVRPEALNTWFDLKENRKHVFSLKSVCGSSTLCLRWEELLTGRQLDGQGLSAVYLPASHRGRLLWDVSTPTTSIPWKYSKKRRIESIFSPHCWPLRVHRPVDFPAWCEVRVEPVTCRVALVQAADPRLPCFPGENIQDPSHGSPQLQQEVQG